MTTAPSYDILVCSIPHRHASLCALLAELGTQMQPGAGVLIYRDNLEASYGAKCQALLDASAADYVSWFDDDDLPAPDFVSSVMKALAGRPDYVGFPVRWTLDGVPQIPVEHSLRHGGWHDTPDMLQRDIVQFNPVRREIALAGHWEGGYEAERRWADQVRASGLVKTEAWIEEPMYYYQDSRGDTFKTPRVRMPEADIPELPSYPWLTAVQP